MPLPQSRYPGSVSPGTLDEEGYPMLDGRAWVFANSLQAADISAPGGTGGIFHSLDAALAARIAPEDVIVGGSEFACGEGGARAAQALRDAPVAVVIARSFGEEFAREAFEIGLAAVVIDETHMIHTGDRLRVDLEGRRVANLSSGDRYPIRELSDETLEHLKLRFVARA